MTAKDTTSAPAHDGVSEPIRRAYEFALFHEAWHEDELAAASGVSVDDAADLMDEMVRLGLLRPSQEESRRLVAVPPIVGLGSLLATSEDALSAQAEHVHRLRRSMVDLVDRFEQSRRGMQRAIEVHEGRDRALSRVGELLRDTRSSVRTVVTSTPSTHSMDHARRGDQALLERGVQVRALYLHGHYRQSAPLREHVAWMAAHGSAVRLAPELPLRFMLFDDTAAMVARSPDDASAGAAVVHLPGVVRMAEILFERLWHDAVAPDMPESRPETGFTDLELTVLRLMAQGCKDAAVSRRTGLSIRSVRRTVASISERLGTQSRFELGLRCRELDII
jgi:DNA-binding CsgD family transcriptional regulator